MVMPPTVSDKKYSTHECPYLSLGDKAIFLADSSDRTLALGLSPITKLNGRVRKRATDVAWQLVRTCKGL